VLSGDATNTNFIVFGLTRPEFEPTTYCTRGEHANYYVTDAVNTQGAAVVYDLISMDERQLIYIFFCRFLPHKRLTKSHMFYRLVVKCIQCNHVTVFVIPFNNACIFIMSSCNIDIKGTYSPRFLCRLTPFMDLLSHSYSTSVKAVRGISD
jgi:hypothetical protein